MKLILYPLEFKHISEKSEYNCNIYKYIGNENYNLIILEICNEDYNYYSYYKCEDSIEIFLGCSNTESGLSGCEPVEIDIWIEYN